VAAGRHQLRLGVRVIAFYVIVFGCLLMTDLGETNSTLGKFLVIGVSAVFLIIGGGLLLGWRWVWIPAFLLSVGGIVLSLPLVSGPQDITLLGLAPFVFFGVLVPSICLLCLLLTPSTLRWFRGKGVDAGGTSFPPDVPARSS